MSNGAEESGARHLLSRAGGCILIFGATTVLICSEVSVQVNRGAEKNVTKKLRRRRRRAVDGGKKMNKEEEEEEETFFNTLGLCLPLV